jgi:hypothetical protein
MPFANDRSGSFSVKLGWTLANLEGVLKVAMTSRRGEAFRKSIDRIGEKSLPECFTPIDGGI